MQKATLSTRSQIISSSANIDVVVAAVLGGEESKAPLRQRPLQLPQREIWIDLFGYVRAGAIVEFEHRGKGDHRSVVGAQPWFGGFEFEPELTNCKRPSRDFRECFKLFNSQVALANLRTDRSIK